jgi:deoxyribonuclease V
VAVACLYSFPSLEHHEDAACSEVVCFPYVPGYLAFREGHAIVSAINRLRTAPDVVLVDGHGIAHPRGIGIASHIGVILGVPTIGCAKSRLVGDFAEPAAKQGSWTYLSLEGAHVGAVLRTRSNAKPVFVSPGHMTDIPSSVEIVMTCAGQYRIPDPLRRADMISRKLSRQEGLQNGPSQAESTRWS